MTLVELPLVLPPAVAGIGLLAAFGRLGLLGGTLEALGIDSRLHEGRSRARRHLRREPVLRSHCRSRRSRPSIPTSSPRRARSAPARRGRSSRVALPLASGGLGAGAALAFARGLGEFGATIMFAGSLQGVTQTLSLAIYQEFDVDFDTALAIGALLVLVSAVRPLRPPS